MGHKELLSALVQVVEINSGIDGIYMCLFFGAASLFYTLRTRLRGLTLPRKSGQVDYLA